MVFVWLAELCLDELNRRDGINRRSGGRARPHRFIDGPCARASKMVKNEKSARSEIRKISTSHCCTKGRATGDHPPGLASLLG